LTLTTLKTIYLLIYIVLWLNSIVTSANDVMFLPRFVGWFVCRQDYQRSYGWLFY